jgi:electron transport complex protein RnfG
MKKLSSSLLNMVIVLTLIAVIAGGILAYVNSVTAPQIEKINADNLAAGIKAVMGGGDVQVAPEETMTATIGGKEKQFAVYPVNDASGTSLGKAIKTSENGFGGNLEVLVGFDPEGTILGYTVLQHAETPGLGAKAGLWFQKDGKGNIIGMNPGKNNFTVSKDGGEVDAITASTITSRAFLKAIQNAYDTVYGNSSK